MASVEVRRTRERTAIIATDNDGDRFYLTVRDAEDNLVVQCETDNGATSVAVFLTREQFREMLVAFREIM